MSTQTQELLTVALTLSEIERANLAGSLLRSLDPSPDPSADQAWPAYICGTQRYLMKSFPYFIVFRVTKTRIEIIAVAHERQRPSYGTQRTVS